MKIKGTERRNLIFGKGLSQFNFFLYIYFNPSKHKILKYLETSYQERKLLERRMGH